LSRLAHGGTLADLRVSATKAVLVSEEPKALWRPRHDKLDLAHVWFICQPFTGKPTFDEWCGLIDELLQHGREGAGLVAIDTLSWFLPGGNESSADVVMKALLPLQRLTQAGMSVLLAHHPGKAPALPGQAARGSSAFAGFADVVIEMTRCPRAKD